MNRLNTREGVTIGLAAALVISLGSCATSGAEQPPANASNSQEAIDTTHTLDTAAQIISTFENSTTEIQYDYAEDIEDGRGITAGRAGFTSGTSDLLMVVREYAEQSPGNMLEKYLPALEAVDGTDSTDGLEGFIEDWETAVNSDETLKKVQDQVVAELYYDPALSYADEVGVTSELGKLIFKDTIIQHGEGEDVDGMPAITHETVEAIGVVDGNELEWLDKYLDIRQSHLEHAADPATREAWRDSADRVEALRSFVKEGNADLNLPLSWEVYGDQFQLP